MTKQIIRTRLFSNLGVSLCANAIEIAGQKLVPDASKAYVEFNISHAFPVVTAYGTALHPGTIANSWPSMQHQVFNFSHMMRAYDTSKERNEIPRDYILGSIVGVEYPRTPMGGWKVTKEAPGIRAAAVIHKHAERVPRVLGEHLGGRHKWTVSMEVDYELLGSGFIMTERAQAKKKAADLMAEYTPNEFTNLGLGYVAMEQAPEELLDTYDFDKRRMKPQANWEGMPVVLLKGGVNGQVHYRGVGLVRYGAEREAEIQQLLASDPDALEDLTDESVAAMKEYFCGVVKTIEHMKS